MQPASAAGGLTARRQYTHQMSRAAATPHQLQIPVNDRWPGLMQVLQGFGYLQRPAQRVCVAAGVPARINGCLSKWRAMPAACHMRRQQMCRVLDKFVLTRCAAPQLPVQLPERVDHLALHQVAQRAATACGAWYRGAVGELGPSMQQLRQHRPSLPVGLARFGLRDSAQTPVHAACPLVAPHSQYSCT